MKSKLEIYALSVCFASVICLVISVGIGGYSLVQIITPELTIRSYNYNQFLTNDVFWKSVKSCSNKEKERKRPRNEVLTKQRLEAYSIELKSEKREGLQTLIRCIIFVLVSCVTIAIHWKIALRSRANSGNSGDTIPNTN